MWHLDKIMLFIVLVNGFIFIGCVKIVKEEDEDETSGEGDGKEEQNEEVGENNEEEGGEEEEDRSVRKRKRKKRKLVLSFYQFCVFVWLYSLEPKKLNLALSN